MEKNITLQPDLLMQTNLLLLFFVGWASKRRAFKKQFRLSNCFPNNCYFLQYFLDIKILYVSLIAETLLSTCLKTAERK